MCLPAEWAFYLGPEIEVVSGRRCFQYRKLLVAPRIVFICHWDGHYFTVGYNNATESGEKHLYMTDSFIDRNAGPDVVASRKFATQFREL